MNLSSMVQDHNYQEQEQQHQKSKDLYQKDSSKKAVPLKNNEQLVQPTLDEQ